jgi:ABC-2 type transport system permease protein
MPTVIQWVTFVNPLRYFLVIIRDIFLKGSGLGILWPQMAALLFISLCVMVLAVRRVSKTLD